MEIQQLSTLLSGNSYPGRGIVLESQQGRENGNDRLFYYGAQHQFPQPCV